MEPVTDVQTQGAPAAGPPTAGSVPEVTPSPPVYKAKDVPEGLRTMTQLKQMRLKPAEGQEPVGLLRMYRRGHGWGEFPLYDPAGAAPMRPLSPKQQAAKAARRTCPQCKVVRDYVVHRTCAQCMEAARAAEQELRARTCRWCRRVSGARLLVNGNGTPACDPCRVHSAVRRQAEAERHAAWARTCPGRDSTGRDCTVVTATDEEAAAEMAAHGRWRPRRCPPCQEAWDVQQEEWRREAEQTRQRRAEEAREAEHARARELEGLAAWARGCLEDDDAVVLDTETTGLGEDARIVELTVLGIDGTVLLDTLVNPGEPIGRATDLHGITDSMVADAPTISEVLPRLAEVLAGRRCLIYNAQYDIGRLRHEVTLHHLDGAARTAAQDAARAAVTSGTAEGIRGPAVTAAREQAQAWLDAFTFEDTMIPYSTWFGDWSDYWGNYAWQPLNGGHRALGDCRAVIRRLEQMAAPDAEKRDDAAEDPWQVAAWGVQNVPAGVSPAGEVGN